MPQYNVEVEFTQKKIVQVFAATEELAEEAADRIVSSWDNVLEITETNCLGET